MEDTNLQLSLAKRHHKQFCNEIEEICQKYENVPTNASLLSVNDGQIINARELESASLKKIYFGESSSSLSPSPNDDVFDFACKKDVTPPNFLHYAPDVDEHSVYSASSEENDVFTSYTNLKSNKSVSIKNKDWETMSVVSVSHFQGIAKVSKAINNNQFSSSSSDDSYCNNPLFDSKESLSVSSDSTGSDLKVYSNKKITTNKPSIFDFVTKVGSKLPFSDSCSDEDLSVSKSAKIIKPRNHSKTKGNYVKQSVFSGFNSSSKLKDFDILEKDVTNFPLTSNTIRSKNVCSKTEVLNTESAHFKSSFNEPKSYKEKYAAGFETNNIPNSSRINGSSKHKSNTAEEHIYSDPLFSEPLPCNSPKKSCFVQQKNKLNSAFSSPSLLCSPIRSINLKTAEKERKCFDRPELQSSLLYQFDNTNSSLSSPKNLSEKGFLQFQNLKNSPRLPKKQEPSNCELSHRKQGVTSVFDIIKPCYVSLTTNNPFQKAITERNATKSYCNLHWERTPDVFELSPDRHLFLESCKDL